MNLLSAMPGEFINAVSRRLTFSPLPVYFIFNLFLPPEGRYKSSRIAALVRGSSPRRALRERASGDDCGDYVDLLITRFSLAFGLHAKIAFTAPVGARPLTPAARPRIVPCRWHDQFFARARSEHSFSCVMNIRLLPLSLVLRTVLRYVCPRRRPAAAIAAATATVTAAAVIVSAVVQIERGGGLCERGTWNSLIKIWSYNLPKKTRDM